MARQMVNGRSIELGTLTEALFSSAPGDALPESKLDLDYPTATLNSSITGMQDKKIKLFNGISAIAVGASASSVVVTTEVADAAFTKTYAGSDTVAGVIVSSPDNKCIVIDAATKDAIHAAGGADVYGRLTSAAGVRTVSFFSGADVAYTFVGATSVDIMFPESYKLTDAPFRAFSTGVGYTEGMPASHTHVLAEVTDLAASTVDITDVALLSELEKTTGAALIGIPTGTFTATDVSGALIELEGMIVPFAPDTIVIGQNLTAQVVSGAGTQTIFTVTAGEYIANTLEVFVRGVALVRGIHFTETTPASGIFTIGDAPYADDNLSVNYRVAP